MSNRAQAVIEALTAQFPFFESRLTDHNSRTVLQDASDGPVFTVSDCATCGINIGVHVSDCDNIAQITKDLFLHLSKTVLSITSDCGTANDMTLKIGKSIPLLDDADFRVGELMNFQPLLQEVVTAAAA